MALLDFLSSINTKCATVSCSIGVGQTATSYYASGVSAAGPINGSFLKANFYGNNQTSIHLNWDAADNYGIGSPSGNIVKLEGACNISGTIPRGFNGNSVDFRVTGSISANTISAKSSIRTCEIYYVGSNGCLSDGGSNCIGLWGDGDVMVANYDTTAGKYYYANGTICVINGTNTVCLATGSTLAVGKIKSLNVAPKTTETCVAYFKSDGTLVSGTSTGGGLQWLGSTANGVGTYVNSSCVCSNPNMSFNGSTLLLNANICFPSGSSRTIIMCPTNSTIQHLTIRGQQQTAQPVGNGKGGNVCLVGGCGVLAGGSMCGGDVYLLGGDANTVSASNGGHVIICGGDAVLTGTGGANGGNVCIYGGVSTGTGTLNCGSIFLYDGSTLRLNTFSTGVCATGTLYGSSSICATTSLCAGTCAVIGTCMTLGTDMILTTTNSCTARNICFATCSSGAGSTISVLGNIGFTCAGAGNTSCSGGTISIIGGTGGAAISSSIAGKGGHLCLSAGAYGSGSLTNREGCIFIGSSMYFTTPPFAGAPRAIGWKSPTSSGTGCALCISGQQGATHGGCVEVAGGYGGGGNGGSITITSGYGASGTGGAVNITAMDGSAGGGSIGMYVYNATNLESALLAYPASCVSLYYAGSEKLKTVTNGICLLTNCGFATDWVATSDKRLKTDIQPISNALSIVTQLQGICYKLCDDCDCENRIGLIAQDVKLIVPEVVSYSEPSDDDIKHGIDDFKLGLKYDKLTAVLIEAIKEQQLQINDLKSEINNLKNNTL